MIEKAKEMFSKLNLEQNKATTIKYVSYFIIAILIFGVFSYTITKIRLNDANCNNLEKIYTGFPKISSFNTNDAAYQYLLRDYYIKTAYNCCCGGQFQKDERGFSNSEKMKKWIKIQKYFLKIKNFVHFS